MTGKPLAVATRLEVGTDELRVSLSDGRELRLRLADFPFLRDAPPGQRAGGVIEHNGTVLWWEDLLEGISVAGLIDVSETELEDLAGVYRR